VGGWERDWVWMIWRWCCSGAGCVGVGKCCEMMMIGWGGAWSVRLRVQGREEDQRGPGERLSEGTVGLMNWARRMPWIVVGGGDDGGCPMVGMGVGG